VPAPVIERKEELAMAELIVFHVQDPGGRPIAGALLAAKNQPHGDWNGVTNPCGDFKARLAAGHYDITISAVGFKDRQLPADLAASGEVVIGLERAQPALAGLVARGPFFQLTTGEYWTAIESTDFRLFARFLDGENIGPVLQERAGLGFNTLRIALTCAQLFRLFPSDHPNYFGQLAAFVDVVVPSGLRPEFTVFLDAPRVMPDPGEQQTFFANVLETLGPHADLVLIELVNEADQPANTLDVSAFAQPLGFNTSHGSNGSQAVPVRPAWSYETFHTNDAPEWWGKVGHNAMEMSVGADGEPGSGVPVISNENTRAPDRFSSTAKAFDAAAGAALLCAGSCFHSVSGRDSVLFTDEERPLAEAWVAGALSVPLRFQDGAYRHRADLEGPEDLRVYSRTLPSGEEHIVHIRK